MITGKHVRLELEETGKVIANPEATVTEKLSAVYKLLTVVLKMEVSIRTNTKLIMQKTGAEPLPPRRRKEEKKDEGEKTE